jgi:catechol 2,3-dioxygenase-like lactoylglutathione lyase family enzyme
VAQADPHSLELTYPGFVEVPVQTEPGFPQLRQVVLDCTDARLLAEFYRRLLGWRYRPGDAPPPPGEPDTAGQDWLVLQDVAGSARVAFQQVAALPEVTWPEGPVPQQLHLDLTVPTTADLDVQHQRALALGARLLRDHSGDPEEPLRIYADPAGHPFCIFVADTAVV